MDTKEENTLEHQALLNKKKQLIRCPICCSRMWRNNFLRHAETKKHQDALHVLHERFEIK